MAAASEPAPPAAPKLPPQPDRQDAGENQDAPEDENEREGGFRRSLIRATFPRPDGQAPTPRANPEFTIQSLNNRRNNSGQRHAGGQNKFRGGRRRPGAGGGQQDNLGPMRFRDHGHGQGQGTGPGTGPESGRRRTPHGAVARRTADGGLHGKGRTDRRRRESSVAGVGDRAGDVEGRRQARSSPIRAASKSTSASSPRR